MELTVAKKDLVKLLSRMQGVAERKSTMPILANVLMAVEGPNALRMAVVGWAKTLAAEVARDGVTVNCLAPGRIATDRVAELDQGRAQREGISVAEVEQQSRSAIPAGRYGEAAEFAAIATFLASARSSYMTGGIIRVDGGMIRSV